MSGRASTEDVLADSEFGVSRKAIRLERRVEMYQWGEDSRSEKKKKLGGGEETVTTYSYEKKWSSSLIDSSRFHEPAGHENPKQMPFSNQSLQAEKVTLGAFTLSSGLISKISGRQQISLDSSSLQNLPAGLAGQFKVSSGALYKGQNPAVAEVGDLRITFHAVNPQDVSVAARQAGSSFEPFKTTVGKSLLMLESGVVTADRMFEMAEQRSKMLTWILRVVGWLCMVGGIGMILKPLEVIADVVPFVGSIIGFGTGLISFLVGSVIAATVVAIAWIAVRPLVGIPLLVIAVGGIAAIVVMKNKGKARSGEGVSTAPEAQQYRK